ncbi:SAM-dependent methyltransferase [Aequitasia blattaphilus]|uniref:Methyltransferase domain-containing protein n=1 Tax=Aequitasia blattaphilus TaxID=2949332 RepID=A0ABT1ECE9_9FIRM|nr:hypothetical protein [Aequitasia blattaphilus]MCP1103500.1 hypothetical protein [Aequitasia blattaphilus]MCR8616140.1 hypothetical protein [Aequitasia blattaphilus]
MKTREKKMVGAYRTSKNIYDTALSGKGLWAKIYMGFLWNVDDWAVREQLFSYIPKDFAGKLLDVPTGTGLFTADKYLTMENAEITALGYSADMLNQARERFQGMKNVTCVQGVGGSLHHSGQKQN